MWARPRDADRWAWKTNHTDLIDTQRLVDSRLLLPLLASNGPADAPFPPGPAFSSLLPAFPAPASSPAPFPVYSCTVRDDSSLLAHYWRTQRGYVNRAKLARWWLRQVGVVP